MEQKYKWLLVRRNLRANRKIWMKNAFLMFVACVLVLVTEGVTGSMDHFMTDYVIGMPAMRNLQVPVAKGDANRLWDVLSELAKREAHIQDVFEQNTGMGCDVANLEKYEGMGFDTSDPWYGFVITATDRYFDDRYLSGGRWIGEGERNVGLAPKYFSMNRSGDMQQWDNRLACIDGNRLIGETISLRYYTYREENDALVRDMEFSHEFEVIGTYENFKAGMESCFVILPYDDIRDMTNIVGQYWEVFLANEAVTYNVMVDKVENVESVKEKVKEIIKPFMDTEVVLEGSAGSLVDFTYFIKFLGMALGIALFIIQGVILSVAFYNQIRNRTKEMGVYKAVGYENKRVLSILAGEIAVVGIVTFAISVAISGLVMLGISLVMKWKAVLVLTMIRFTLSGSDVLLCAILCVTVLCLGSLAGFVQTFRLEPGEALAARRE